MFFLNTLLPLGIKAFLSLIFLYSLGTLILFVTGINVRERTSRLITIYGIGIIAAITFYSIYRSYGVTVNVCLLPLEIFLVYKFGSSKNRNWPDISDIRHDLSVSFLLFLPIFIYQSSFYFDLSTGVIRSLQTDSYFYADFVSALKLYGSEGKFTDLLSFYPEQRHFFAPYHYGELWLAAFFCSLDNISSIQSYYLVVIPICTTIFCSGIWSVFSKAIGSKFISYIIALSAIFVSGIYFRFYDHFEVTNNLFGARNAIAQLMMQKFCMVYVFALWIFLLLMEESILAGFMILGILSVFCFNLMPALLGSALLFVAYRLVMARSQSKSTQIIIAVISMYLLVFTGIFYAYFKSGYSDNVLSGNIFLVKLLHRATTRSDYAVFISNFAFRMIRPVIYCLPLLPFIYIFLKRYRLIFFLTVTMLAIGTVVSCLLYNAMDSRQFSSNVYILFNICAVLGLASIGTFSKTRKWVVNMAALWYGIVIAYSGYALYNERNTAVGPLYATPTQMNEISLKLDNYPSHIFCFMDSNDFASGPLAWWGLKNDLWPILQYSQNQIIFSVANPELFFRIPGKKTATDSMYYRSIFPVSLHQPIDADNSKFLIAHNARYVYCRNSLDLPATLKKHIADSVTVKGANSTFYVLNWNHN